MAEAAELLVCRLGEHRVAILAREVVEVLPMLELSPLPQLPRHCLGIFDFRGTLTPAYDLGARLGAALVEPEPSRHLLVAQVGEQLEAWVVDRIVDLKTASVLPAPALETASETQALLSGIAELDSGRVAVLSPSKLLKPGMRAAARALFTEVA